MQRPKTGSRQLFRVWIVRYRDWEPRSWHDMPPHAEAVEPAMEECLPMEEAAVYVAAFNQAMLGLRRPQWAVCVPVAVRLEGDLQPGQATTEQIPPPRRFVERPRLAG